MTFSSTGQYLSSFIYPLIEETRADLHSNIQTVARAPTREIISVGKAKDYPKKLSYRILMKELREIANVEGTYEPEVGDLIALTDVKPKCINDLNRPQMPYLLGLVTTKKEDRPEMTILSSKPIAFVEDEQEDKTGKEKSLFVVYLTNMTTNNRIWQALNSGLAGRNMNIIKRVMQFDSTVRITVHYSTSPHFLSVYN